MTHGRTEEAERVVDEIEDEVRRYTGREELPPPEGSIFVEQREAIGFGLLARAMLQLYPVRTVLGLVLTTSQAFLFNAIFYYRASLVLGSFFGVPSGRASPTTWCSSPSGTCWIRSCSDHSSTA